MNAFSAVSCIQFSMFSRENIIYSYYIINLVFHQFFLETVINRARPASPVFYNNGISFLNYGNVKYFQTYSS